MFSVSVCVSASVALLELIVLCCVDVADKDKKDKDKDKKEKDKEKKADPFTDSEKPAKIEYEWEPDWGEQLAGIKSPRVFALWLNAKTVTLLPGVPDCLSVGEVRVRGCMYVPVRARQSERELCVTFCCVGCVGA